jgi:hypothetical protein
MARLLLVHWNAAEAGERAARVSALGHEVHLLHQPGQALRHINAIRPQGFLISLERLPAQGRAIAALLRERKSSRHLPIVFLEGAPEKIAKIGRDFPDAVFAVWKDLPAILDRALSAVVANPARPGIGIAAPNSPLVKKLCISSGIRAITLNAPESFERTLGPLPEGATLEADGRSPADIAFLFCESEATFVRDFDTAVRRLTPRGRIWIAWPKKASRIRTDLDMNIVRAVAMSRGWVDYKVCSIDSTWSASLCSRRRA